MADQRYCVADLASNPDRAAILLLLAMASTPPAPIFYGRNDEGINDVPLQAIFGRTTFLCLTYYVTRAAPRRRA